MNILRTINNWVIKSGLVTSNFTKWKIEGKNETDDVQTLFPVGCIGLKKTAKLWISKFQANNYSFFVSDYADIIKKFNLKDGDYFYGKDNNYILVQDNDIKIKTANLNVDLDNLNITISGNIKINDIILSFSENKISINGKEIAVIGGDVNTTSGKIITSGQ